MSNKEICQFCNLSVKDKYTLKTHILKSKSCLKKRGLSLETNFICKGCQHTSSNNTNLIMHIENCKEYIILKIKDECKEEYEKQINKLKNEISDLTIKFENTNDKSLSDAHLHIDILQKTHDKALADAHLHIDKLQKTHDKALADAHLQIDKLQKMLGDIASKAVDKPTTTVNNQIRNCFSTTQFLEDIKPADVKRKCQTNLTEQILMEGQRGIARLCTEQFINTTDKKKLLISTDHSSAKFRYMDKNGNMKDDIEARTFIEKVSKPIKEVADIVFDNVLSCIKDEKEMLEEDDYGRKAELNNKELQANTSMMYIKCFDDPNNNSDFTNELSILNQSK